jgi:hypothetical protein
MSRRPIALLSIALATLSLAACTDVTAPTSQRQIKPTTLNADTCIGGTLDSTGRHC